MTRAAHLAPSAEQVAHARAETLYRVLVEAAPNAIIGADARGRITLVNPQAEALFGYTSQELLGEPVDLLVPEQLRGGHEGLRAAFGRHPANRPMGRAATSTPSAGTGRSSLWRSRSARRGRRRASCSSRP